MTDDFYCEQALNGKTSIQVVAETAHVLAFHHTRPFWPAHIVVVPKRHIPSLVDLGDADSPRSIKSWPSSAISRHRSPPNTAQLAS